MPRLPTATRSPSCPRSAAAELAPDVRLLDRAFDPGAALTRFAESHRQSGGIASFLGQVRSEASRQAVLALELTHYEPLTLPAMRTLGEEAVGRWVLDGLLVRHRVGVMEAGEPIVLVAAAALHRRDAFLAADFVMDHLKSAAWLWKRERTAAGWRWIEPRAEDHADHARW